MNTSNKQRFAFPLVIRVIVCFSCCCLSWPALGQDELLIPLPGENSRVSHSASDSEIILPLPPDFGLPGESASNPVKVDQGIIALPVSKASETSEIVVTTTSEPPIEFVKPPTASSAAAAAATTAAPANNAPLPAFPKDTSSAIFMLMKNWECTNYDGFTLLGHSINTYGQEAEDKFEIKGLDRLAKFNITLKEDDITLDELLDIMANKNGFDWGVDIPGKIIYLYPGGK